MLIYDVKPQASMILELNVRNWYYWGWILSCLLLSLNLMKCHNLSAFKDIPIPYVSPVKIYWCFVYFVVVRNLCEPLHSYYIFIEMIKGTCTYLNIKFKYLSHVTQTILIASDILNKYSLMFQNSNKYSNFIQRIIKHINLIA